MSRAPHSVGKSIIALSLVLAMAWVPTPALASQPDPAAPDPAAPAVAPAADTTQAQPVYDPNMQPQPQPVPAPAYDPNMQAQPLPPQPIAPPPPNRNRGIGLLIAGSSVFAFSYLISVGAGVMLIDSGKEEIGRPLLIPIAGPFIGIGRAGSATAGFGLAFAGIAQLAGLGMAAGGGVMLARSRRQAQLSFAPGGLQLRF